MLGHVLIYILSLNFEKQAVSVSVEKLTALSILTLHLVIIEVIHELFGEVEDAHPHINGTIENQTALVHMKCCKVIIEYVCPSKCWAGYKVPDLVLLTRSHQLDIKSFSEIFHCLPEDRIVHELVEVFLKAACGLFPELCVHLDVGLHPGALSKSEGPVDFLETHTK